MKASIGTQGVMHYLVFIRITLDATFLNMFGMASRVTFTD